MQILIVGAGIGGLALMSALHDTEHSVDLVERRERPGAPGGGIVLHPNGVEALRLLGLSEALRSQSHPLSRLEIRRGDATLALSLAQIWNGRGVTLAIARTALHELLRHAALAPSSGAPRHLHAGRRLVGVEPAPRPIAHFDDGSRAAYDLLVGADGAHSAVRQALFPGSAAVSTQLFYFRFLAENVIGLAADTWSSVERPGAAYGFIPIAPDRLHCFVQVQTPSAPCPPEEAEAYVARTFLGWDPALARAFAARRTPVHADFAFLVRPVVWGRGACVLLGDAAHAVSPTLSEGGSLAIEDALVLARALAQTASPAEALPLYQSWRGERVAWAHRMALAQLSSLRNARPRPAPTAEVALRHLQSVYRPLGRGAIPETVAALAPEARSPATP